MEKNVEFVSVKPKSEQLKDIVDYFYFHKSTDTNSINSYIFYPNQNLALTIYKNSSLEFDKSHSIAFPDPKKDFSFIYSGIRKHSIQVEMSAPFDKIGIVFHPLGINRFLDTPLHSLMPNLEQFELPIFSEKLSETCAEVFNADEINIKVDLLETKLIELKEEFNEDRIIKAVSIILNSEKNISVNELADKLDVNRKTLYRLFKLHLNCSVQDYIEIVRFRKALDMYQSLNPKPKLIEIAYNSSYYDQSEFIRQFKKITGYNPKKILGTVDQIGSLHTFWTFLNKK